MLREASTDREKADVLHVSLWWVLMAQQDSFNQRHDTVIWGPQTGWYKAKLVA